MLSWVKLARGVAKEALKGLITPLFGTFFYKGSRLGKIVGRLVTRGILIGESVKDNQSLSQT